MAIAPFACDPDLARAESAAPPAEPCRPLDHGEASYVVCTIDLARYELRMFLRGIDGQPYGSFARLIQSPEGRKLAFAMNGGMYDENRLPVGLYVENGRLMKRANTTNGTGNFHLKPNGVFYASGETAGVLETGRYLATRPRAEFATQSGPMLVHEGEITTSAVMSPNSTWRKIRNGVCAPAPDAVVFVISETPVTFFEFAAYFREQLHCHEALYLDGSISRLYARRLGREDHGSDMGPIIGVTK